MRFSCLLWEFGSPYDLWTGFVPAVINVRISSHVLRLSVYSGADLMCELTVDSLCDFILFFLILIPVIFNQVCTLTHAQTFSHSLLRGGWDVNHRLKGISVSPALFV